MQCLNPPTQASHDDNKITHYSNNVNKNMNLDTDSVSLAEEPLKLPDVMILKQCVRLDTMCTATYAKFARCPPNWAEK